jgi:PAS domain-containing protein
MRSNFSDNLVQTANVVILDLDGAITIFNQGAQKITGYTWADQDKNWFEVLTPRDRYPKVWEEFLRFKATGVASVFENPILTKSGRRELPGPRFEPADRCRCPSSQVYIRAAPDRHW